MNFVESINMLSLPMDREEMKATLAKETSVTEGLLKAGIIQSQK